MEMLQLERLFLFTPIRMLGRALEKRCSVKHLKGCLPAKDVQKKLLGTTPFSFLTNPHIR